MLSLGPMCVDASSTEIYIRRHCPKHTMLLFLKSEALKQRQSVPKQKTNIRNVLSFEPDLCFITTLKTHQRLSVLSIESAFCRNWHGNVKPKLVNMGL